MYEIFFILTNFKVFFLFLGIKNNLIDLLNELEDHLKSMEQDRPRGFKR